MAPNNKKNKNKRKGGGSSSQAAEAQEPISGEPTLPGPSTPLTPSESQSDRIFTNFQPPQVAPAPGPFGASWDRNRFDFSPTDLEARQANHKLKKAEDELANAKGYYEDEITKRDDQLAKLTTALENLKKNVSTVELARDHFERGFKQEQAAAQEAIEAKVEVEKELSTQKESLEQIRVVRQKLFLETQENSKAIENNKEVIAKFKDRVSELTATNKGLHEELDGLQVEMQKLREANEELVLQNTATTNEINEANKELEQMFQDGRRDRDLDLAGYVGHIRDMMTAGTLKRHDSSVSLDRHLSPQKSSSDLRIRPGMSLQDQMAGLDDASSERSIPYQVTEEGDEEDQTLTDLGLGHTWSTHDYLTRLQDQEQKINELQKENERLLSMGESAQAATQTPPATSAFTHGEDKSTMVSPNKPATLALPGSNRPSSQYVNSASQTSFSANQPSSSITKYTPVEIQPLESQAIRPATKYTYIAQPPTFSNLWSTLPTIWKLASTLAILAFLLLFANVAIERYIWLSANDLTRRYGMRMGSEGLGVWQVVAPMLELADYLIGVEDSFLG